jgi:hypothetical protein
VRRLLDVLLVAAVLAAAGFGAYKLGHHIDAASNKLAQNDPELNQSAQRHHSSKGPSRHTIVLVVGGMGVAAGVIVLVSLGGGLVRARRRQRWRVTA